MERCTAQQHSTAQVVKRYERKVAQYEAALQQEAEHVLRYDAASCRAVTAALHGVQEREMELLAAAVSLSMRIPRPTL